MPSSLESQGLRGLDAVGPVEHQPRWHRLGTTASAFAVGGNPSAWHFQTQLSDGSIVAEEYYSQTSSGVRRVSVQFPPAVPAGERAFGPAYMNDPRNPPMRHGRLDNGGPRIRRFPFSPFGLENINVCPHRRRPRRLRDSRRTHRPTGWEGHASVGRT
ncbi:MAG: hypothetical protein U0792_16605 [Gemmataceae bacterium]